MTSELEALAGATVAVDALDVGAALNERAEPPPEVDEAAQWEGVMTMIVTMAAPILPTIAAKYPPITCKAIGEAMVPVAEKYGWQAGTFPPEITLLILIVAPWSGEIIAAVKSRRTKQPPPEKTVTSEPESPVETA